MEPYQVESAHDNALCGNSRPLTVALRNLEERGKKLTRTLERLPTDLSFCCSLNSPLEKISD